MAFGASFSQSFAASSCLCWSVSVIAGAVQKVTKLSWLVSVVMGSDDGGGERVPAALVNEGSSQPKNDDYPSN